MSEGAILPILPGDEYPVSRSARRFNSRFHPASPPLVEEADELGCQMNDWRLDPSIVAGDYLWGESFTSDPSVLVSRVNPVPWDLPPHSVWPLNEVPFVEDLTFGGGRPPGNRLYMDSLNVAGRIELDQSTFGVDAWDSVRLLVVLDLTPEISQDGNNYVNPIPWLFVSNAYARSHVPFHPLAYRRFRILADHRFDLRPPIKATHVDVAYRPFTFNVDVPPVKIRVNPDNLTVNLLKQSNAFQPAIQTAAMPTMALPFTLGGAGGLIGPSPPPPPLSGPPQIFYDQQAFNDVSTMTVKPAAAGGTTNQVLLEAEAHQVSTGAPPSHLDAVTDINALHPVGDRGVDVNFNVDLRGYYADLARSGIAPPPNDYRVVSGALWLIGVKENGVASIVNTADGVSRLFTTLYYVST